jgi:hypothetical protein
MQRRSDTARAALRRKSYYRSVAKGTASDAPKEKGPARATPSLSRAHPYA